MGYLALAVALHTVAWFAAEAWFVAGYGLPFGPRAWMAALAREALVPVLAAQALARTPASTGAAPTWPQAGVPGMAPPERAYENGKRHG